MLMDAAFAHEKHVRSVGLKEGNTTRASAVQVASNGLTYWYSFASMYP